MRIENELQIDAPIDVVWRLTTDVESWPSITPTMTSVERLDDGPIALGSRARVKQPGQRAAVWTVTALETSRLFEWRTSVMGIQMIGRHELAEVDGGTRNTLVLELSGRGAGAFGKLVGKKAAQSVATENAGFKSHAEHAGTLEAEAHIRG